MNNSMNRKRLIELVGLLCDEIISEQQFNELEGILEGSEEARRVYHVYTTMANNLRSESRPPLNQFEPIADTSMSNKPTHLASPDAEPNGVFPKAFFGDDGLTGNTAINWILSAILLIGIAWFAAQQYEPDSIENQSFAQVLGTVNVVWKPTDQQFSVGELIDSRRLTIQRGVVHVRFNQGANVAMQGPADFEIINARKGFLHKGQIAVYVPKGAEGFQVDTPQAEVIDLGTEFGLSVDSLGESQVHVFAGEVEYSGLGDSAEKAILTAGLAVALDGKGQSRPVELKERSFEVPRDVLWTRYRYSTSISSQFIAGNGTELPGSFPGRIGGGWTSQWVFECEGGEIASDQTLVRNDHPLGSGLENYLNVVANNPSGGRFSLKMHRGFESMGEKFDCREDYLIQFLIRVNSDVSKIHRIQVSDLSFDESASKHAWKLVANQNEAGELEWRGLPLVPSKETDKLVPRERSPAEARMDLKTNCRVRSDAIYRIVAEVQPNRNRYRISLSDGEKTLVGNWTKDIASAAMGDRLERRLEWMLESEGEISVSLDSIRIQNEAKFD